MHELEVVINTKQIKERFKAMQESTDADIIPVIKNNANGLGTVEMYNLFFDMGAKFVACSYANEFYEKLKHDDRMTKFAWIWTPDMKYCEVSNLVLVCKNFKQLDFCLKTGIPYFLEFNIVMNRGGFFIDDLPKLAEIIPKDDVVNIMAHCPYSDNPGISIYKELVRKLKDEVKNYLHLGSVTVANSIVFKTDFELHEDFCRVGELLLLPRKEADEWSPNGYNPIEVKTYLADNCKITKGKTAGYCSYVAKDDIHIGILPIGYYSFEQLNKVLMRNNKTGEEQFLDVLTMMHDTTVIHLPENENNFDDCEFILMNNRLIEENWNRCIQRTFKLNRDLCHYTYI